MERAGRWLALRPRTAREMRKRLAEGGFEPEVVEAAVARLTELCLLDDRAFARQWIEERSRRKGLGGAALVAELTDKGIDRSIAEEAAAEVLRDELPLATQWASGRLRRIGHLPLPRQAERLEQGLLRRGFEREVVEAALRAVLPPEGWD